MISYLLILTLLIVLVLYFFFGYNLIKEKKYFILQFGYIFFYLLIAPFLHIIYGSVSQDLYYDNFIGSIDKLNFINIFNIVFMIFGLIVAFRVNIDININKTINWVFLKKVSIVYIFLSTCYLIYLIGTGGYFYSELSEENSGASLIEYMLIESTPMILSWFIIAHLKIKESKSFWWYFILFTIFAIIFSGARGSRIAVIFQIINFLIIYTIFIRSIDSKKIMILLIVGWLFNSLFSNYKYGGIQGLQDFFSTGTESAYIESKDNKTLHFLLGDLGRSDVQAKIISSIDAREYSPTYSPQSYLYGLSLLLPEDIKNNFLSKRQLGTRAQYGFEADNLYSSSRIYGLLGESLLNFGYYLIFPIFFMYGVLHFISLRFINLFKKSALALFCPLLFFIPIYLLFYDFDNIVFQVFKNWVIPFFIFLICVNKSSNKV